MTGSGESLQGALDRYRAAIDVRLRAVSATWDCDETLKQAMVYALEGGKRLRGAVLLSFCEGLAGGPVDAVGFAAALEMVHAYSLVHDDLPCMDDDDFRRGKPSCHKKFGYATALLCGDALLTAAFESAASSGLVGAPDSCAPSLGSPRNAPAGAPVRAVVKSIQVLSRAAGPSGMVGGQSLDLGLEGTKSGPDQVSRMYEMKTGALFEASARIGATLAGAAEDAVEAASRWGSRFGYAYQVLDDLEDLDQSRKEQEKDTLAGETSPGAARRQAAEALEQSLSCLATLGGRVRFPEELSRSYLAKTRGI